LGLALCPAAAKDRWDAALALLAAAALTDFLDGFLARRFFRPTLRGALLDPLADKVFTFCALYAYCFLAPLALESWLFYLFLVKDGLLILGAPFALKRGKRVEAALPGKLSTALLFALLLLAGLFNALGRELFPLYPLELAAAAAALYALVYYARRLL